MNTNVFCKKKKSFLLRKKILKDVRVILWKYLLVQYATNGTINLNSSFLPVEIFLLKKKKNNNPGLTELTIYNWKSLKNKKKLCSNTGNKKNRHRENNRWIN